jgi:hypothetical protein
VIKILQNTIKNTIIICVIIFLLLYICDVIKIPLAQNSTSSKESLLQNSLVSEASKSVERPQPLPETGTTIKYYNGQALAPLKIITKSGDSNYLINVLEWDTKNPVLIAFIRSGETANLKVPLGSYEIRYATGETWYGYDSFFGSSTSYYKAESRIDFTKSGNTCNEYTIELNPGVDGNLNTSNWVELYLEGMNTTLTNEINRRSKSYL